MSVYDLWLPILLAGLATHILSTIAWMALPHHKPEWNPLTAEDELIDLLDTKQIPADQYMFPFARDPAAMKDEAYLSSCCCELRHKPDRAIRYAPEPATRRAWPGAD